MGFVTEPLARLSLDPGPHHRVPVRARTDDAVLGAGADAQGHSADDIRLSLERNMQCGIGLCGHCQLGPILVCRDGPVVSYALAEPLLTIREL